MEKDVGKHTVKKEIEEKTPHDYLRQMSAIT